MTRLKDSTHALLRKSERFLKTDMVYLAKGGSWLISNQAVASLAGLASAVFFAHLLPKDVFGIYKYILSLASIISSISLSGLATAVTQSTARGFEDSLRKGFWLSLKWGSGMTIISFGMAVYYWLHGNSILAISLVIVGTFLPIWQSSTLYGSYLQGKKAFKQLSISNMLRNVLPTLGVMLVLLFSQNLILIVITYFVLSTGTSLWFYLYTLRVYHPNNLSDPETEKFSMHLSFLNILGGIADQVDRVAAFHFLGAAELATYSFAVAIPDNLEGIFKSISTLAFPNFSSRTAEEIKKSIIHKILVISLASIPIVLLYIFTAPYIFHYFFPRYADSVPYSQIYSLYLLFSGVMLLSTYFSAKRQLKNIYISGIAQSVLRLLTTVGFFFGYGLWTLVILQVAMRLGLTIVGFTLLKTERHSD